MLKTPRPHYALTFVDKEEKPVFKPWYLHSSEFDPNESRDDQAMDATQQVRQIAPEVVGYTLQLLNPTQAAQIARTQRREALREGVRQWWNDTTRALVPDMVVVEYCLEQASPSQAPVTMNLSNIK